MGPGRRRWLANVWLVVLLLAGASVRALAVDGCVGQWAADRATLTMGKSDEGLKAKLKQLTLTLAANGAATLDWGQPVAGKWAKSAAGIALTFTAAPSDLPGSLAAEMVEDGAILRLSWNDTLAPGGRGMLDMRKADGAGGDQPPAGQASPAAGASGIVACQPLTALDPILKCYRAMSEAFEKRDADGYLAYLAPEYRNERRAYDQRAHDYSGAPAVDTREQEAAAVRAALKHQFPPHEYYLVLAGQLSADGARAEVALQIGGGRGNSQTFGMRTDTWAKRGGQWRLVMASQRQGFPEMGKEAEAAESAGRDWIRPEIAGQTPTRQAVGHVFDGAVAQQIRARYQQWAQAFQSGNSAAIAALISPTASNREALLARYGKALAGTPERDLYEDWAILSVTPSADGTRAEVLALVSIKYDPGSCDVVKRRHVWTKSGPQGAWMLASETPEAKGDYFGVSWDYTQYRKLGGPVVGGRYGGPLKGWSSLGQLVGQSREVVEGALGKPGRETPNGGMIGQEILGDRIARYADKPEHIQDLAVGYPNGRAAFVVFCQKQTRGTVTKWTREVLASLGLRLPADFKIPEEDGRPFGSKVSYQFADLGVSVTISTAFDNGDIVQIVPARSM